MMSSTNWREQGMCARTRSRQWHCRYLFAEELRASGWNDGGCRTSGRQARSVNQSSHLTWPQIFNENRSHNFDSKVSQSSSIPCSVCPGGREGESVRKRLSRFSIRSSEVSLCRCRTLCKSLFCQQKMFASLLTNCSGRTPTYLLCLYT